MRRIGIDIGGTQLRVATFEGDGVLVTKAAMPNDHTKGPAENLERLACAIEGFGIDYEGVGIGCPGPLDFSLGRILNPPNLPGWEGFDIVRWFEDRLGCRAVLNNDANVAGLAEARLGAGRGLGSVVYLTVSTGVGAAYVLDGHIVGGAHSCAAEVFNMVVVDRPSVRLGMNGGALEDQASGTAIGRMASERLGMPVDAAQVFALRREGNEVACAVVDDAATMLARGVCSISCVVDPDIFVFGGSVALYNPDFVDLVHKKARDLVLNPDTLTFALAECGGDAGLMGAALLV